MPARHRFTRARILVAGVLGTATVLAACNSDDGKSSSRTTISAASSSTTTPDLNAAVIADYRAFWDAFLAAANPMSPGDPRLAEHAVGEELQKLNGAFLARKSAGQVINGSFDLAPVVVEATASEATLRDCYHDRTLVYDANGQPAGSLDTARQLITVKLLFDASSKRWKVASITREAEGCTSAA